MEKKARLSVYLDPDLMRSLADFAARRGQSRSLIAEAAIASLLSPDTDERREAAAPRPSQQGPHGPRTPAPRRRLDPALPRRGLRPAPLPRHRLKRNDLETIPTLRVPTEADDEQLTAASKALVPESATPPPKLPPEPMSSTTRMDRTGTRTPPTGGHTPRGRKQHPQKRRRLTPPKRPAAAAC